MPTVAYIGPIQIQIGLDDITANKTSRGILRLARMMQFRNTAVLNIDADLVGREGTLLSMPGVAVLSIVASGPWRGAAST